MRRLVLLALAAALLGALAAPAAAAPVAVGIADNKPDLFDDPRFAALGVKHVRTTVPWDVLQDPQRLPQLDRFMAGARRLGVRPLVSFDRSPRRISYNPTPAEMVSALRGLRARYPGLVRDVIAWNEPNINKKPALVARWWVALQRACSSCRIAPGELVDRKNAVSYAQRVAKAAKRTPRYWGLHNYVDTNNFRTTQTRAFLNAVRGEVWLTETGGVVARSKTGVRFAGQGPLHAAQAVRFLFQRLVPLSTQVTRIYLYNWNTTPDSVNWDSGFVGPDHSERPSLQVLREELAKVRSGKGPKAKKPKRNRKTKA